MSDWTLSYSDRNLTFLALPCLAALVRTPDFVDRAASLCRKLFEAVAALAAVKRRVFWPASGSQNFAQLAANVIISGGGVADSEPGGKLPKRRAVDLNVVCFHKHKIAYCDSLVNFSFRCREIIFTCKLLQCKALENTW